MGSPWLEQFYYGFEYIGSSVTGTMKSQWEVTILIAKVTPALTMQVFWISGNASLKKILQCSIVV